MCRRLKRVLGAPFLRHHLVMRSERCPVENKRITSLSNLVSEYDSAISQSVRFKSSLVSQSIKISHSDSRSISTYLLERAPRRTFEDGAYKNFLFANDKLLPSTRCFVQKP